MEVALHLLVRKFNFQKYYTDFGGHAVAQLGETLHYKPEGRGFDSRRRHWNF
jgi:hypothetical protein